MSDLQVVKTFHLMRLTRITQTHAEPAWERSTMVHAHASEEVLH